MKTMNVRFKRLKALLLAVVCVLPVLLGGCNGNNAPVKSKPTNVYKCEYLSPGENIGQNISYTLYNAGKVYFCVNNYLNDTSTLDVYSMDTTSGSTEKMMSIDQSKGYINGAILMTDGSLCFLRSFNNYNEETGESTNKYTIERYGADGSIVDTKDMAEIFTDLDMNNINFNSFSTDSNGNLYTSYQNIVYRIDKDYKLNGKVEFNSDTYINKIFTDAAGKVYAQYYDQTTSKNVVSVLNFDGGKIGETVDFSAVGNYIYNLATSPAESKYDFYYNNNSAVCGYDVETNTVTELCNWVNSDINSNYVNSIININDETMLYMHSDYDANEYKIGMLTHVPDDQVVEKYIITLAANYLDSRLKTAVIDFNKKSEEYKIVVKEYSVYNTEEDYTRGTTMLNNDIIAGNIPDLLQLDRSAMPVSSYTSKGLFADLYKFIDSDEEIKREDYLTNVLDAFSIDGKLYELVPTFNIQTVAAKKSTVNGATGLTMDEFNAILAAHPEAIAFYDMTQNNLLNYMCTVTAEQFIDYSTGECHFDSDGFKKVLEFANNLSQKSVWENFNWEEVDENYWERMETACRDGRVLFEVEWLSSFRNYWQLKMGTFGDDIELVGFPTDSRQGSAINPSMELAMSAISKVSEGAWSFLRYVLTDEFQNKIVDYGFPLKISRLEAMAEEQMKPQTYTDWHTGEVIKQESQWWMGGESIKIGEITKEYVDIVINFIKSINQVVQNDEELYKIIQEEAAAYFAGSKSIDETVKIIQSRASIYVNESR